MLNFVSIPNFYDNLSPPPSITQYFYFFLQCGKFHNITLFDGSMRTCRERLDRHAARRRKSHARQAVIRRGSPMDDIYVPGRRDTSSLPQQRRQNTQIPRYDVEQVQPSYLQQQQQQHAVSNPMLDLAHQILQHSAAGQRSLLEQQRAIQHYEQQQQQQQQMLEHLVVSMASARPSPENLLNPLYTPTPLRFGPSQHPQNFVGPSTIDPTAAATKMKAVLAVLLNEAAATAAPPPPPQQQNGTEALQSMLQRLVAIAASGSGGNKSGVGGANAAPRFLPPAPRLSMVNALNTIAPPTIAAAPAVKTTTTSNEFAVLPSSLPSEITELAPQLRAALEALLKYEQGTPQL